MKKIQIHQDWQFWKEGQEKEKNTVQLPHDAMQEEARIPELEKGSSSGYYPGGKYYYERKFFGSEVYGNQSVLLEFEGIYMNATVFLNGVKVGGWIYGYTNFFVDLTDKIRIGEENVLLVVVDNSKTPNSRWYSGSGIYRPVQLWTGGRTYIGPQGLKVKTMGIHPTVIEIAADIVHTTTEEAGQTTIDYTIYDGEQVIATASGAKTKVELADAKLWSAEAPHLYTIRAELIVNGTVVDEAEEAFGIRSLAWNVQEGFLVNGEAVKLRGGCIHHDNGILGACAYEKAEYRRIKKLKEFGFNAIRESHYPASKALLKACDELGMYVIDESFDQWRIPNTTYDYSTVFDAEWKKDITALVEKDYNHPSVVMYGIGNEITDTGRSYGAGLAQELHDTIKNIDDTRPTMLASNVGLSLFGSLMEAEELEQGKTVGSIEINEVMSKIPDFRKNLTPKKVEELVGGTFDAVDIAGYNYGHDMYENAHKLKPNRIFLSSETNPSQMANNWKWVKANPWCIGDFLWTAWDYLGEAGVGLPVYGTSEAPFAKEYPCLTATCGSFDLIGNPEAAAYYEAILWNQFDKPYIGVRPVNHSGEEYTVGGWRLTDAMPCWTWDGCKGKSAQVIVYSVGYKVELLQDGKLIAGRKLIDCKAEFAVPYHPGSLEAVSYDENGQEIARSILTTNGSEERIAITPEETKVVADPEEIIYVPIQVVDEQGKLRMMTDKQIKVTVEGAGQLLALGSGRPETEEAYSDNTHMTWHGSALAVIRCTGETGEIHITVEAEGCERAEAVIKEN